LVLSRLSWTCTESKSSLNPITIVYRCMLTIVIISPPLILRPGGVTLEQLRELVPSMEVYSKVVTGEDLALKPPTPGLKYKHYSPDAQVILFEGPSPALAIKLAEQMKELLSEQKRVGYIHTRPNTVKLPQDLLANRLLTVSQIGSEDDLGRFHNDITDLEVLINVLSL
jgi:hypothetical protein